MRVDGYKRFSWWITLGVLIYALLPPLMFLCVGNSSGKLVAVMLSVFPAFEIPVRSLLLHALGVLSPEGQELLSQLNRHVLKVMGIHVILLMIWAIENGSLRF